MNESKIILKSIHDLLPSENQPYNYWIPSYQRGYRWTALQVTQLLDDILEFTRRQNPKPEDFYCLQPIVVKQNIDTFEVVDGQQRLTTIFLILRHFNDRLADKYRQKLFTLSYETRKNLIDFLDDPTSTLFSTNADFHHLHIASQTIEKWFSDKGNLVEEVKSNLLNKTKIIWFQLSEHDNAVDAFTRLNVGKIPLTNEELIRALFLNRSNSIKTDSEERQIQIAHEWDQLEKSLQKDAFWYFLSNKSPKHNRIGFLFELIVESENGQSSHGDDTYSIFYSYNKKLKEEGIPAKREWLKIKQLFMMLEEWFEDRVLYHIIGYLINRGESIVSLRALSLKSTKTDFKNSLKQKIFEEFSNDNLTQITPEDLRIQISDYLDELRYGRDSKAIRSILLLFNVATLIGNKKSNILFQFDSFKSETWDIEHVRSVTTTALDRHQDRVRWLTLTMSYLETQDVHIELTSRIKSYIGLSQKDAQQKEFDDLYGEILRIFKEDNEDETDNGIFNLTLLDQTTNRSYKNAVFAVKRKRLLEIDQAGIFVPICTKNIFLKSHSPHVDNTMFWSKEDREAYRVFMINTLVDFFSKELEG